MAAPATKASAAVASSADRPVPKRDEVILDGIVWTMAGASDMAVLLIGEAVFAPSIRTDAITPANRTALAPPAQRVKAWPVCAKAAGSESVKAS